MRPLCPWSAAALAALAASWVAGCAEPADVCLALCDEPPPDAAPPADALPDAPLDAAPRDAGADAGLDAGGPLDAGLDAGADAGPPLPCTAGTGADPAPVFAGVSSATPAGRDEVVLRWSPASDATPPDRLAYLVFVAERDLAFDYGAPAALAVGATEARVVGLATGVPHRFVVRARDGAAQVECNEVEARAVPWPLPGCVEYEAEVQPLFDAHCVRCHGGATPLRDLSLESHAGALAGGLRGPSIEPCDADASYLVRKCTATPPAGLRMPTDGPPYLSPAELGALAQWVDQGARASCAEADVCAPP